MASLDISFAFPSSGARSLVTRAYDSDPTVGKSPVPSLFTFRAGWWWYRDRLFVPTSLRPVILSAFHDPASVGHPGVARMLSSLSRTYSWPDMRADVLKFVASCDSCQRVKIDTKAQAETLQPLPVPDRPWSIIGMNFIVKLPRSHSFDSVWVIVDHFTKGAHFIPCNESMNASDLAALFVQHFFRFHGLPDKIVSDRGPLFVSAFWLAVQKALHIKSAPSTAYHPQTDGQTERTNQTLETYLRHFSSHRQDDWVDWLPVAEFCFNNSTSASTKLTPFFSWQGFHPRANSFTAPSKVPKADEFVSLMETTQVQLVESLNHAKAVQARFYDAHAREVEPLKPGTLVWLSRRNIPSQRPSSKLDYRRIGPFRVVHMVGRNAARLDLGSAYSRLHPVFNISLLTPYVDPGLAGRPQSTPLLPSLTQSLPPLRDWRHVAGILDFRSRGRMSPEYLLRWVNGTPSDDTWVPLRDISRDLDGYLLAFHDRYKTFKIPALLEKSRYAQGYRAAL